MIFKQLSSLEKVFLEDDISNLKEKSKIKVLKGERFSYQIAFSGGEGQKTYMKYSLKSDLPCIVRRVENVPSSMPAYKDKADEFYIKTEPGLYPDLLSPMADNTFEVITNSSHALFVTVDVPKDVNAGTYDIEFVFSSEKEEYKKVFTVKVLDAVLPEQKTIYTQWFHADCIASYYNYEVFSEEHWAMIDKFMKKAAECGINMLLTPVFTPPLDTDVGRERSTTQLVDVSFIGGEYKFGFDKLKRWIDMCRKNGIERFEISHLFSQWGTGCTPKIEAETEKGKEKIFGWHTKADSAEYRAFLKAFLPELTAFLKSEGVYDNTFFHVSDEPDVKCHFEIYKTEREMLDGLVPPEKIMDAISHTEFCECGLVRTPIAVVDTVDNFIEKGIENIWAYYCCGPSDGGYTNRFIAMPSGRNRVGGFLLYKYGINGFLHWGFNFYYSQLSRRKINPFVVTDADEAFPSGDCYAVYPGEDGPWDSLRSLVFYDALQDIRACELLAGYIGRDEVVRMIEESGVTKFNEFPRENCEIDAIRDKINDRLDEVIG